jgi:hypothetical protein
MRLKFITAFHPHSDGQSKRTNQILEDMLWAYVLDFKVSWVQYLPLIEFCLQQQLSSNYWDATV